jgi:sugar lactone lactonase YvrE
MTAQTNFAYDRGGNLIVIGDNSEVLVHSGADESPLWRKTLPAPLAGVGATADTVITLDANGKLTWWNGKSGQEGETVNLNHAPRALAVKPDGTCAVSLPESIVIINRVQEKRTLLVPNAGALAFSDTGSHLAVGTDDGRIRVFPAHGDDPIGSTEIQDPVRSIAWNGNNFWLATSGDRVFRVDPEGKSSEQITRAGGMTPDCVASSADGTLIAVRLDPKTVVVLAYPSKDSVATIQYTDRRAVGLAFGPVPYFGIGLDSGDGNKFNLRTKAVHRTDTHPGRTHNSWLLSVAIETNALPTAYRGERPPPADIGGKAPLTEQPKSAISVPLIAGLVLAIVGIAILISQCN